MTVGNKKPSNMQQVVDTVEEAELYDRVVLRVSIAKCGQHGHFVTYDACSMCCTKVSSLGKCSMCKKGTGHLKRCYQLKVMLWDESGCAWAVAWEAAKDILKISALDYSVLELKHEDREGLSSLENCSYMCTLSIGRSQRKGREGAYIRVDRAEECVTRQLFKSVTPSADRVSGVSSPTLLSSKRIGGQSDMDSQTTARECTVRMQKPIHVDKQSILTIDFMIDFSVGNIVSLFTVILVAISAMHRC